MAKSGDIAAEVDFHVLRDTLKRIDPESEKALKKALNKLGTDAKRLVVGNAPVGKQPGGGQLKRSIGKRSSFTAAKSRVEVTSKVRYAFIVEYGRQKYRPFAPRHYVQATMQGLEPRVRAELEKAKRDALRVFE